jgi:ParB family chromosome partitioning protein
MAKTTDKQLAGLNETNPDFTLVAGSIKGAMKQAGAGSRDLWLVPRDQIRVIEGFNVRIKNDAYKAHIRFLADSMKEVGFKSEHPLSGYVARDGDESFVYIFDGHCRLDGFDLAVSEGAELEHLTVVVGSQACDMEDLTVNLDSSNSGKPLEPLERAAVCKRLVLFGWDEPRIAKRLGLGVTYVLDLLLLIGSPKEVRAMVASGQVSSSTAIAALKEHGNKALERLSEALARAQGVGKAKVTQRFMADPGLKVVKKTAGDLYGVVQEIKGDPSYSALSEGLRTKLDALLESISQAQTKAAAKSGKTEGSEKSTQE